MLQLLIYILRYFDVCSWLMPKQSRCLEALSEAGLAPRCYRLEQRTAPMPGDADEGIYPVTQNRRWHHVSRARLAAVFTMATPGLLAILTLGTGSGNVWAFIVYFNFSSLHFSPL